MDLKQIFVDFGFTEEEFLNIRDSYIIKSISDERLCETIQEKYDFNKYWEDRYGRTS